MLRGSAMLSKQPNFSALTIDKPIKYVENYLKKIRPNTFFFLFRSYIYIYKTITFDNSSLMIKKNIVQTSKDWWLVGRGGEGSRGGVSLWQSKAVAIAAQSGVP